MGLGDNAVEHRTDSRTVFAHDPRHPGDGHRQHRQDQHLGLERRGEVLSVWRHPGHLGRDRSVLPAVEAGQPAMKEGLVLPYVQVAPRSLPRGVDAVRRPAPGHLSAWPGILSM